MKASLARRLFRTILAIGLINVGVTLIAAEFIYEDVEDTILRLELAQERDFIEQQLDGTQPQTWHSALLSAYYLPAGARTDELPALFQQRPVPFSAEVDVGAKAYLVSIERTQAVPGTLYMAQDISLLEDREDEMQTGMVLLGLCMLGVLGALLARFATRRLVGPLHALTHDLARIHPGSRLERLNSAYEDAELAGIAHTLNQLLDALDAYVQREKSLVSLASHELRTPVAVIAGALDVLEQRNTLSEADRRTVARIRRAASEMRADVDALLKLARRSEDHDAARPVDLPAILQAVIGEIESGAPEHAGRVHCQLEATTPAPTADPALVRMLLRNLIQNAVRHTQGQISISYQPDHDMLRIADSGLGLPAHIRERLDAGAARDVPDDGLGLFIVRLICERLGWQLHIERSDASGTVLALQLPSTGTQA